MATPTTSTPSRSTATARRTCRRTTCASTSGTWPSPTAASVSFPAAARRPGLREGRLAGGFCFPQLWVGLQRVNEGGHEILLSYLRTLKPRLGGLHLTLPSSRVAVIPTVLGPHHPGMEEEMRVRGWPPGGGTADSPETVHQRLLRTLLPGVSGAQSGGVVGPAWWPPASAEARGNR